MLITIGAFDGFHKGHAELLRICRENSDGKNWGAVTLHPPPSEYMHRLNHSLFTLREKEFIRLVLGIPNMYVLKFDDGLMNLSPSEFWALLRGRLHVDGLVMGSDFRFGRGASGNAECLKGLAEADGLRKIFIADVIDKVRYSSSQVRECVRSGSVDMAAEILGYPFFMMGRVLHGNERGRTLGYPTANIDVSGGRITPAYGVYSCSVLAGGEWHCGALSVGINPTFRDVHETRAEVHILGFSGDIYGEVLPVFLLGRVRDIKAFNGKDELTRQIARDVEACSKIYKEVMDRDDTKKFMERAKEIYSSHEKFTPEIITLI